MYLNQKIRVLLFVLFIQIVFVSFVDASMKLNYLTRSKKDNEIIEYCSAIIDELALGQKVIDWKVETSKVLFMEKSVIDANGDTKWWEMINSSQGTFYKGVRENERIIIKGTYKGESLFKELSIDQKPFFINPKWGLSNFVLSNAKTIEFWGLRTDKLEVHLMKAVKKGEDLIVINGEEVKAIRVDWTTNGMGKLFFNRSYWFRKSDGLYIKQTGSNQKTRVLVAEEAIE